MNRHTFVVITSSFLLVLVLYLAIDTNHNHFQSNYMIWEKFQLSFDAQKEKLLNNKKQESPSIFEEYKWIVKK